MDVDEALIDVPSGPPSKRWCPGLSCGSGTIVLIISVRQNGSGAREPGHPDMQRITPVLSGFSSGLRLGTRTRTRLAGLSVRRSRTCRTCRERAATRRERRGRTMRFMTSGGLRRGPCSVRPPWRTSGSERFPHSTSAPCGGRLAARGFRILRPPQGADATFPGLRSARRKWTPDDAAGTRGATGGPTGGNRVQNDDNSVREDALEKARPRVSTAALSAQHNRELRRPEEHRSEQAAAGFEPANDGFANRSLSPLGYAAKVLYIRHL